MPAGEAASTCRATALLLCQQHQNNPLIHLKRKLGIDSAFLNDHLYARQNIRRRSRWCVTSLGGFENGRFENAHTLSSQIVSQAIHLVH